MEYFIGGVVFLLLLSATVYGHRLRMMDEASRFRDKNEKGQEWEPDDLI